MAQNEIQRITIGSVATPRYGNGQIKLTAYGETTADIDVGNGYLDSEIAAALEAVLGEEQISNSVYINNKAIDIEFTGTLANRNIALMTWQDGTTPLTLIADAKTVTTTQQGAAPSQVYEVQTISFSAVATGGSWTINSGTGMNYNASANDVQGQLYNVSVSGDMTNGFEVTWTVYGNQTEISVTSNTLTDTNNDPITITVGTTTEGVDYAGAHHIATVELDDEPTGGTWYVILDSSSYGPIDYNASAATVEALLTGWTVSKTDYVYTFESVDNASHTVDAMTDNLTLAGALEITTIQQGVPPESTGTVSRRFVNSFRTGTRGIQ